MSMNYVIFRAVCRTRGGGESFPNAKYHSIEKSLLTIMTKRHPPVGFILYSPKNRTTMELIQIDPDAQFILSSLRAVQTKRNISPADISSLCNKWKGLVKKRSDDKLWDKMKKRALKSHQEIIDFFQGGKRYTVNGRSFSSYSLKKRRKNKSNRWLFVLEEIKSGRNMDLDWILRNFKLNRRQHEIIKLLFADCNNKEIAGALGLSINTVKGYLKILMRKLGVSSRTGIVASLMTGKHSSPAS
jgi:DNA-binding CsgD family transcriptional regulator